MLPPWGSGHSGKKKHPVMMQNLELYVMVGNILVISSRLHSDLFKFRLISPASCLSQVLISPWLKLQPPQPKSNFLAWERSAA